MSYKNGTLRFLALIINSILLFFGCVMIILGAIALHKALFFDVSEHVHAKIPNSAAIMILVAGIVCAMLSFLGCWAAVVAENHCMLMVYAIALSCVVALEIAAGIVAFTDNDTRLAMAGKLKAMLDRKLCDYS